MGLERGRESFLRETGVSCARNDKGEVERTFPR